MIYVTRPVLPSFFRYVLLASSIWRSRTLTNNGRNCQQFSNELKRYLSVDDLYLTNNGTSALQVALSSLDLPSGSEVITTAYSFVATSNAIVSASLKPVFVDIAPNSYNICTTQIENAITPNTKAILPVHVYGIPSNIDAIADLGRNYNLPIIYDSAHSFGVTLNGKSLLSYGDLSICSFHATKVFNTAEGGCIVKNIDSESCLDQLINFGFTSENDIHCIGTNAKMNEFSAVLGLLNLQSFPSTLIKRSNVFSCYMKYLDPLLVPPEIKYLLLNDSVNWNYSYLPIKFDVESGCLKRDHAYTLLRSLGFYSRKYFYPLINETSAYALHPQLWRQFGELSNSIHAANTTLCLPIYPGLQHKVIKQICNLVNDCLYLPV